jgi:hypothetical protein
MYSMNPWAIMNTQEVWAQPSPPTNSTIVTMVTSHIDSRVTAGSITQLSPSPPLLLSPPALPSMDGPYVQHSATPTLPNVTVTMETGRNKGRGEEKHLSGILDETGRPDQGKPCAVVGKRGDWFTNYLLDPGKSPPPTPISTNASKTTRFVFPGGNRHPPSPSTSGTYTGPTALPTWSDVTKTLTRRSRKVDIDGGRRLRGVLDETKRLGQPKPQFAVVEGSKWLENHSSTDKTPQDPPPPTLMLKTTQIASLIMSLGDNHPLPPTPTHSTCI